MSTSFADNNDDLSITLNDTQYLNSQEKDYDHLEPQFKSNKTVKSKTNVLSNKSKEFKTNKVSKILNKSLSSWGLPENILLKYKERGISDMFLWQVECLGNRKVIQNNSNLVYSAPTSAGKTLVAEILALKTLLEKRKKVLMILPFVSVVREKMFYFQDILSSSGIRVEGFMGSHSPPGGFKTVQFAICTIEKANSIINKSLEDKSLIDVGAVIVDEMHLLGDSSRGYLLELLLTKLRYMSSKSDDITIQLIGMSATLSNLDLLSKWLSAELYTTTFRPIPLKEYCLMSNEIFDTDFKLTKRLKTIPDLTEDTDNILQLCLETISNSCSVLIFCPTKNWCENLAQQISVAFYKLGISKSELGKCLRDQLNSNAISEILEQLKRCPVGLDAVLKRTVSFGVAFHHAGLTMDERDIIEGAFRNNTLRILVATSTLSSGVNLPAQRVIIRTPMFHGKPLDSLVYRQMIGRAGRMGRDTSGESILICQKNDKRIAEELLAAKLYPIESCLEGAGKLKRAILEVVASGVATSPDDINLFTNCTLLAAGSEEDIGINNPINQSLEFLIQNEFIRLQKNENGDLKYVATNLAKACLSSSLPPEDGLALLEEIEKARKCFVLDSDLHLLYLVTPYSVCSQWTNLDWMFYLDLYEKLTPSMRRVAELVGVQESFICNATRGRINTSSSKLFHRLQIHRRFYTALALQDLVNEVPLTEVAEKFQCNRGMLQSLQQSASMFAGMVTSFCAQLGWKNVEILISQFQDRLQFGIQHELLELMKLSNLNGQRARALYNSGIESLTDLASIEVCKLENILLSAIPFESEKERDGESAYEVEQKRKIRGIWITGKQGLTARDAAIMLIKDARKYLQLEIGAAVLKWDGMNTQNIDNQEINKSTSSCYSTGSETENTEELFNKSNKRIISNKYQEALKLNTPSTSGINNFKSISNNENFSPTKQNPLNLVNFWPSDKKDPIISNEKNSENLLESNTPEIIPNTEEIFETEMSSIDLNIANFSESENISGNQKSIINNSANNSKTSQNSNESNYSFTLHISDESEDFQNGNVIKETNENELNWTPLEIPSFSINTSDHRSPLNELKLNCSTSSTFTSKSDCSLFGESIYLNSNLCNALDSPINNNNNTKNKSKSHENEMGDTSFFNNISEQFSQDIFEANSEENEKNDVIENSQTDITDCSFISHYSIKRKKKKRDMSNEMIDNNTNLDIVNTPRKKQKIDHPENATSEESEDLKHINIIEVCNNKKLFETFCEDILQEPKISLALACEKVVEEKPVIGQIIITQPPHNSNYNSTQFIEDDRLISGVAISCGTNTVFYISFKNEDFINNSDKLKILQNILNKTELIVRIFDCKEHFKVLYNACKIVINSEMEDPKIGDWLLEPEGNEKNLSAMALKYSPEETEIAQLAGNSKGVGSIALDVKSSILSKLRASVEVIVTWKLIESQKLMISEQDLKLIETFKTEMKSLTCLAKMELKGLKVDKPQINKLITILQEQMATLQQQAFSYTGRRFSFTSSKDVAKAIGIYKGKRVSTNKQILELSSHPVSKMILQWRKLNCTLTKVIYPIIRSLKDDRIHGCCVTHSSTGRISMHEPNLQNIPRNFEIIKTDKSVIFLSPRSSFIPSDGKIFLSADYSQLELRLLAHLSQDSVLCRIMRKDTDVFKSIASKLNNIPEELVTDILRQRAKQLCYGIIYGMGVKALSEQLNSTEEEATEFINTFKVTYPKIQEYIQTTIKNCQELGYVRTLACRKRFLPQIKHENLAIKSHAERQAVNTTIQGSAADIAKTAMILIDEKLKKFYFSEIKSSLVLHLHDELLYEVPFDDLKHITRIVKNTMEKSVKLSIPFPVKVKCGPSWGELEEFRI